MLLREIAETLHLSVQSGGEGMDRIVTGGYAGDQLSDVIAHGKSGNVWVTMQVHVNIVAVAILKELAGIIIVQGRQPADEVLRIASEKKVPILASDSSAYETVAKLAGLGLA
jgi:predicted transcriptional regulator